MIDTKSNQYTFIFAVIVCVVCGVMLSAFTEGLREQQELNAELDIKRNILKAVGLKEPLTPKTTAEETLKIYAEKIEEKVIDEQGNEVSGKKPADLTDKDKNLHPLYLYKEGDQVVAYAFPIVGQGLWSTLYGYLALETDATTIRGITFYKHGETPGLGGEIEKEWFQNNFKGKTIYSVKDKKITPTVVVKGQAKDQYQGDELKHHVDGITAATITGQGVTDLLAKWITIYESFFVKIRTS